MVNDLCFTRLGTVASVGSDGGISIWDTNAKSLIHKFDNEKMPVLKCAFNRDSKLFAYACGLDWQDTRQQDRYDGYVKITRVEPSNIKPKNLR